MKPNFASLLRKPGLLALAPLAALAAPFAPTLAAEDAAGAAHIDAGRQLFDDWGCASCHALKDAGASGHIGPALDGNGALTKDFTVGRITNGQGAMPGFGGLMTDEEIDALADYIVAKKAA